MAKKGPRPVPPGTASMQGVDAGGAWKSERQRRFMWAKHPRAAHKTAHWRKTKPADFKPPYGPFYKPSRDPNVKTGRKTRRAR